LLLGAPALAADTPAARSPLDRLKQRSAAARWEEVRSQWTSVPPGDADSESTPRDDDETFISPPISATPWVEGNTPQFDAADVTPPAMMNSGSRLSRVGRRAPVDVPSAPAASGDEDWFFGPADPLAQQRALSAVDNRSPAGGPVDPERPVTLPEFLQLQQEAFEAAFGQTRVVTAFAQEQNQPESVLRPPPEYVGLRPITSIQPFRDYDPKGGDPCEHLCPVPGKCPPNKDFLCPDEYSLPDSGSAERLFAQTDYYWLPSNTFHNPLYFEDPALERYGHIHYCDCVEPFFSLARFGVQVVSLPYQMALDPVCKRQYALGWYRPGDFAPKKIYQVPLNGRAAATAVGVYAGLFWLLP
jgi:hypothetical protein